jgi:hypothetical protein
VHAEFLVQFNAVPSCTVVPRMFSIHFGIYYYYYRYRHSCFTTILVNQVQISGYNWYSHRRTLMYPFAIPPQKNEGILYSVVPLVPMYQKLLLAV